MARGDDDPKLTAGDGYTYLTRQVASADTRRGGQDLAGYYTATGTPPGVWAGAGAAELGVRGEVTETQMKALFGAGLHPDAEAIITALTAAGADVTEARGHARLGRPFPDYTRLPEVTARVADRVAAHLDRTDQEPTTSVVAGWRAEEARRQRHAVAGYDLVFSPVKSISLLWALGETRVRREVEAAHHAAVADTIAWLETHAVFTRIGTGGSLQVPTRGLIAAAFEHRESRAGDPDLHTHVAVANKVRTLTDHPDGSPRWLALDGRALYAVAVAASERYNTRVEDGVRLRLGVGFAARSDTVRRNARPIREILGVPTALVKNFSRRRLAVETRWHELLRHHRAAHGEPGIGVRQRLAQQATLETRQLKTAPVALVDQLARWRIESDQALGADGTNTLLAAVLGQDPAPSVPHDVADVVALATATIATLEEQRSTWTRWNLVAEAERQARPVPVATPADRELLVDAVVARATNPARSIRIVRPQLEAVPAELQRGDGTSMTEPYAAERYTTRRLLDAETDLLDAAREPTGQGVPAGLVRAAIADLERAADAPLDDGQRHLAEAFCTDPRRIVSGVGPAGSGKTTALRAACAGWDAAGSRVIPLATSAAAAELLADDLGRRAENIHKYLYELDRTGLATGPTSDDFFTLCPGDVLLVDEASMAGTLRLHALLSHARSAGAQLRLVGDPYQLGAVEAGGAFRLLVHDVGAVELTDLHRFADPAEAAASLRLRDGNPAAIEHYEHHGRLHGGTRDAMLDAAYNGWLTDMTEDRRSLLVAATGEEVTALNQRARLDRIATGAVTAHGVELHDGTVAGVGDWVTTRRNLRLATTRGSKDFVKNGDRWTLHQLHADGSAALRHHRHGGRVLLPADYLKANLDLGYAATAHRAQGATVDTAHVLVTDTDTRETLYVAASRARDRTSLYTVTDDERPELPRAKAEAEAVLAKVLLNTSGRPSAIEAIRRMQSVASLRRGGASRPTPTRGTTDDARNRAPQRSSVLL